MEAMLRSFYRENSEMKNLLSDLITKPYKVVSEPLNKTCCFLFFILLCFLLPAQKSEIHGINSEYAKQKLHVYTYLDEITRSEEGIGIIDIDDSGRYSATFNIKETKKIFIPIGACKGILYLEPNCKYEIVLPPYTEKTQKDWLNPYYIEPEIQIGIVSFVRRDTLDLPESVELNQMIYSVDTCFEKKINRILLNGNISQTDTSKMLTPMSRIFPLSNNEFFNQYKKYKIGMLKYAANPGAPKENLTREYFTSCQVNIYNPAFMDLFHKTFDFFFNNFKDNISRIKLFEDGLIQKNYSQFREAFTIPNINFPNELTDLFILNEIYTDLYSDKYPKENLLMMLDSVSLFSPNLDIISVAKNIKDKFEQLLPGNIPPDFSLIGLDKKEYSLSGFRGKYVYLDFCSSYSFTCQQEYSLLDSLQKKYQNILDIVTILVDKDFENLNIKQQEEKSNRIFLHFDGDHGVIKKYNIKALPTYFLINPEGRFVYSPAPSPSEGFEINFYQLLKRKGISGF